MTDKTLGQIAFEALVMSYGEQVDAKEWPGMAEYTHKAWQAAAEAAADEYTELLRREVLEMREKHGLALLALDKLHPVIEAARAAEPELRQMVQRHIELFGTQFEWPVTRLLDAINAFIASEGRE